MSLIGKSFENYLATKVLLAILGFLMGPILLHSGSAWPVSRSRSSIPVWLGLILAVIFFLLPDLEVKQKADAADGTSGTR